MEFAASLQFVLACHSDEPHPAKCCGILGVVALVQLAIQKGQVLV